MISDWLFIMLELFKYIADTCVQQKYSHYRCARNHNAKTNVHNKRNHFKRHIDFLSLISAILASFILECPLTLE